MNEEEAKEKWCPFVNLTTLRDSDGYYNICDNRGNNDGKYCCLGSQCMAWVWDTRPDRVDEYNPRPIGHCGLVK